MASAVNLLKGRAAFVVGDHFSQADRGVVASMTSRALFTIRLLCRDPLRMVHAYAEPPALRDPSTISFSGPAGVVRCAGATESMDGRTAQLSATFQVQHMHVRPARDCLPCLDLSGLEHGVGRHPCGGLSNYRGLASTELRAAMRWKPGHRTHRRLCCELRVPVALQLQLQLNAQRALARSARSSTAGSSVAV